MPRQTKSRFGDACTAISERTKHGKPANNLTEKLCLAIENRARFTEDGDHLQAIREALTDSCYEVVEKVTYKADSKAKGLKFRNRITGWGADVVTTNFLGTFTDLKFTKP